MMLASERFNINVTGGVFRRPQARILAIHLERDFDAAYQAIVEALDCKTARMVCREGDYAIWEAGAMPLPGLDSNYDITPAPRGI